MKISAIALALLANFLASPLMLAADADHDGLDDSVETGTGIYLSPSNTGTNPSLADSDSDGVSDGVEVTDGTNPNVVGDFALFSLSLTARFAFDRDAGDSSGMAAHGSLSGDPATVPGVQGQAVDFDGVDDAFARTPTPTSSLPYTWTIWVKVPASAFGTWVHVMELGQAGRKSPGIEFYPVDATHCKMGLYQYPYGSDRESDVMNCADSTAWHHLAFTSSAAGVRKLYFDGVEVHNMDIPSYGEVNNTLYLGGDIGLGSRSKYQADEVRLYNRYLDGGEIAAMYDNQKPVPPTIITDLPPLLEVPAGTVAALAVSATGNPLDFTYQWYLDDISIPIAEGGMASALNVTVGDSTAGHYRCRVTNAIGFADSSTCLVAPSDDGDGDGLGDWREVHVFGCDPTKTDSDEDGLPDGDEVNLYATNPAFLDSDDDGYTDGHEVSLGTDPVDAGQNPAGRARIKTAVEFRFSSAIGHTYRIESSDELDIWQTIESGITGNGGEIQRFYSTEAIPKLFLRAVDESAEPH